MKRLSFSKKLIFGLGFILLLMRTSSIASPISTNNVSMQNEVYAYNIVPDTNSGWTIKSNTEGIQAHMLAAI